MNPSHTSTTPLHTPDTPAPLTPPHAPSPWWGLSWLGPLRRDYLGVLQGLHRQYGEISHMQVVNEQVYDLHHPELVREALVEHADQLIRWERGVAVFRQVFGRSVLVTEGSEWQRQRRMLMPAFTPRRVAGYAALMHDAAATALEQVLPTGPAEAEVDMDALWARVTMDIILRTLFGQTATADEVRDAAWATRTLSTTAMGEMFWPMTLPDRWPLPGKAAKRRALATLHGLIQCHIDRHRAAGAGGDELLAQLRALRDDDTGAALAPQELHDQCLVVFQAGHETSATGLLWWSQLVATHPDIAQRLHDEIDRELQGQAPGADVAARLPWLVASLKEALRLYPPIAALMTRRTTAPITLGRWAIPRGALLRITPWTLHRDAQHFPNPDAFQPERFLPGAPTPPRGAWMPFGTGPRVCLGQHFALQEMTLAAALLLQRCTWRPVDDAPPTPRLDVTLRPAQGLRLRLRRR